MWKRTLSAVFLALAASPGLASDAHSGTAVPACDPADVGHLATEIHDLSRRVGSLERKIEEREAPRPTPEEQVSAKIEQERRAEFLQRVWTDG